MVFKLEKLAAIVDTSINNDRRYLGIAQTVVANNVPAKPRCQIAIYIAKKREKKENARTATQLKHLTPNFRSAR